MNAKQYQEYQESVAHFFKSEGVNNLSVKTDPETGETEEPYFSASQCDCCGSTLGGDRYNCDGFNPETKEVQDGYEVCTDCVYYAAYGELDDQTMLDIERSAD